MTSDCTSSPDITLASVEFLPCIDWCTKTALNSDHIPINITVHTTTTTTTGKEKSTQKSLSNYVKADWESFCNYVDLKISCVPLPQNVHWGEKTLREIINKAAHLYIPAGKYKEIRPNFPSEASRLADQRDHLRQTNHQDPRIETLSKEISKLVNDNLRKKWREHLDKLSFKPGTRNLWQTIKRLNNPERKSGNITISFNEKLVPDAKKSAAEFNNQFTPHPTTYDKSIRNTVRSIHKLKSDEEISFTPETVLIAIENRNNSKALGPDDLSPIMLKHLGPTAINFISTLFNLCMKTCTLPGIWKISKIVPLLKPNKPVDKSNSYRPISLLSPVIKIYEALILKILENHIRPSDHQHGFCKNRSTTTALHQITHHIQCGLNDNIPHQRSVLVALNLSPAFDTVSHSILLKDILIPEFHHS